LVRVVGLVAASWAVWGSSSSSSSSSNNNNSSLCPQCPSRLCRHSSTWPMTCLP
jgi:hypothetical protein